MKGPSADATVPRNPAVAWIQFFLETVGGLCLYIRMFATWGAHHETSDVDDESTSRLRFAIDTNSSTASSPRTPSTQNPSRHNDDEDDEVVDTDTEFDS